MSRLCGSRYGRPSSSNMSRSCSTRRPGAQPGGQWGLPPAWRGGASSGTITDWPSWTANSLEAGGRACRGATGRHSRWAPPSLQDSKQTEAHASATKLSCRCCAVHRGAARGGWLPRWLPAVVDSAPVGVQEHASVVRQAAHVPQERLAAHPACRQDAGRLDARPCRGNLRGWGNLRRLRLSGGGLIGSTSRQAPGPVRV